MNEIDGKTIIDSMLKAGNKAADIADLLQRLNPNGYNEILNNYLHNQSMFYENIEPVSDTPPSVVCLNEVEITTVKWLWKPYIPYGKLTLLEGDPGEGKSWVSLAVTTAGTLGTNLPNQELPIDKYQTLIASAEDGLSDTIKPHLQQLGADTTQIHAIDGLFTLDAAGFNLLESFLVQVVPGLVIVDPLVAYLSANMDIHKANQVRYAMARLAKLADKYGCAILAVRHLTKGRGSKNPLYQGLGSIDFAASARSILMAGSNPDNPQDKGIVQIKCNLALKGLPIGYELREDGFYWKQTTTITVEQIMGSEDAGTSISDAIDFLTEQLSVEKMEAERIYAEGTKQGISQATLRRAKKSLNIESKNIGEPGKKGAGKWYWQLPGEDVNR